MQNLTRNMMMLMRSKKINYLEGTGTQFIRLFEGITDETFGLKMIFSMQETNDNYPAGFTTTNGKKFLFFGTYMSAWRNGYGNTGTGSTKPYYYFSKYPCGINNFYTAGLNFLNDKMGWFEDETPERLTDAEQKFTNVDFLLFKSYAAPLKCRIKRAILTRGSEIIRDVTPCLDYHNVPCMYCSVTRQYFYNAGTGTFLYG